MDIHRARFVAYPPSAINALAFSHAEPTDGKSDPDCLRLALGRANGNIELWNPACGSWQQERVFYGGKDRSVEGLAWTQEADERDARGRSTPGKLRLFSIGWSSAVTEWDLATGLPARNSDGNHSPVWCFAAQPRAKTSVRGTEAQDEVSQKLVAGCADGSLVLLSTADDDLRFEKFVAKPMAKKARVLSVVFKDRRTIIAGFADSMIRVYDARNGYVIRTISLGNAGPGGPRETLVWKVKCLPTGDFVSGDSAGDIRIYDGKNYSQTQRISGHEADVLDLAVSRDGSMIFSGGMDRRTCFYTTNRKIESEVGGQGGKWRKISHQRYHEHDVKAIATYDGTDLSVVISGGIDTQPITVPIQQFGKELSRGLPALPHHPPLLTAPEARLLVSWWNCEIRIWRVKSQEDGSEKPKVIARLALQGDENISSASITSDGGLLAVSTVREVKLFQLLQTRSEVGSSLRIRKIEMPVSTGARLVRLTRNGKWLAMVNMTNDVLLTRVLPPEDPMDRPRPLEKLLHLHRLERKTSSSDPRHGPLGHYSRSINHAEFSSDGTVFAVSDLTGYVDTWVVEGHEDLTAPEIDIDEAPGSSAEDDDDSDEEDGPKERITFLGQRWICNPSAHLLPRLDATPVLLSFEPVRGSTEAEPNGNPAVHPTRGNPHPHSRDIPEREHRLLVATADQRLYLFEVLAGRLSGWSRRNPLSSYPVQYRILKSPAKGCVWDVNEHQRIWLYGEGWLFMFDLSRDLPIPDAVDAADLVDDEEPRPSKKRKREVAKGNIRKGISGAGDAVPESEAPVTKMRRFDSGEDNATLPIDLHGARTGVVGDEDLDEEQEALASLRRSREEGLISDASSGPDDGGEVEAALEQRKRSPEHWWCTFKYRSILGMAPIGQDSQQPPEVVIVERPSWELDLPPRFVGVHEQ